MTKLSEPETVMIQIEKRDLEALDQAIYEKMDGIKTYLETADYDFQKDLIPDLQSLARFKSSLRAVWKL